MSEPTPEYIEPDTQDPDATPEHEQPDEGDDDSDE